MLLVLTLLACAGDPPAEDGDPPGTSETGTPGTGDTPTIPDPPTETTPARTCPDPGAYDELAIALVESGPDLVMTAIGGPTRDELVVFLHGSSQEPTNHGQILGTAAYAGYRVIGLQYTSLPDMSELCLNHYDPAEWAACGESGHLAKIYGDEHTEYIAIPDAESIVGRLHTRLTELHAAEPDAGWDQYFLPAQGSPPVADHESYLVWDRILLGGFSQGGGHAALMAREHQMDALVLVSAPVDPSEYVDWVRPGATPGCAVVGFEHQTEDYAGYIDENWDLLEIPGVTTPLGAEVPSWTDAAEWPPFEGAQRFSSGLQPDPGCTSDDPAHGSMANDVCLNVADAPEGDPYTLFRPYLYAFCRAGDLDPDGLGGCTSP